MTGQAPGTRFIPELETTRGIAALLVAGYHACAIPLTVNGAQTSLIEAAARSDGIVERAVVNLLGSVLNGDAAVLYFFVLSGFVLAASLERESALSGAAAMRFGLRRVLRIYPAVFFAVLMFAALHYGAGLSLNPQSYGLESVLRNALLLDVSINGVMWTMQTELLATPLIFLCSLLAMKGRVRAVALLAILLAALALTDAWTNLFVADGISRTQPLFAFALGVLAWFKGRDLVARLAPIRRGTALGVALFCFFIAAPLFGFRSAAAMIMQAVAGAGIIAVLAFAGRDAVSAILTAPAARLVGRASFSFYLLHPLSLAVVWPLAGAWSALHAAGIPAPVLILGLWAATSAAIMPLALASHRYVELPAIAFGRRMLEGRPARGVSRVTDAAQRSEHSIRA